MSRLQLVEYPLSDILFSWKQVGFKLEEEEAMFMPEGTYETDQSSSERADGEDGRHSPFMSRQPTSVPMLLLLPVYRYYTLHALSSIVHADQSPVQCPSYQCAARGCPRSTADSTRVNFTKSFCTLSAKG